MKFHYRVDLEVPDDFATERLAYAAVEGAFLEHLRNACEAIDAGEPIAAVWTVEPARPELVATGLVALPMAQPRTPEQLFEKGYELIHGRRPGELDRSDTINIDARHATIHQAEQGTKFARCGNCGTRYEITDDATENHHRAMRHKLTCGKGDVDQYSEPQRQQLLSEFHQQPMQMAFRERAALELAAGADPERLRLTGVALFPTAAETDGLRQLAAARAPQLAAAPAKAPARWWQFWKWSIWS